MTNTSFVMVRCFAFLLLCFFALPVHADVFKYVDGQGNTHYVDDAEKVPEQYQDQVLNPHKLPNLSKIPGREFSASSSRAAPVASGGRKKVEIYVTSWCPYCRALEKDLTKRKIRFKRYDIERNNSAKRKFQQIAPGGGVPVIVIGEQVIRGYKKEKIYQALGLL